MLLFECYYVVKVNNIKKMRLLCILNWGPIELTRWEFFNRSNSNNQYYKVSRD